MMTNLATRARRQEGFTLIELLITILIIGILAAIGLAAYNGQRNKAKDSQAQTAVRSALTAARSFKTINDTYGADASAAATGLAAEESTLTFQTTKPTTGANATPTVVMVDKHSANQLRLCAASKSGKVFCIFDNNGTPERTSGNDVTVTAAPATADATQTGTW